MVEVVAAAGGGGAEFLVVVLLKYVLLSRAVAPPSHRSRADCAPIGGLLLLVFRMEGDGAKEEGDGVLLSDDE